MSRPVCVRCGEFYRPHLRKFVSGWWCYSCFLERLRWLDQGYRIVAILERHLCPVISR